MADDRSSLPKTGPELRDWLAQLFPDFIRKFDDPWYFPPDRELTPHAVCSEFTDYYRTKIPSYTALEVIELFRVTEIIVAADRLRTDAVANALCTCFLENIAGSDKGHAARPLMGAATLRFFDGWHYPYLDERRIPRSS
jgi:hypothetical protein